MLGGISSYVSDKIAVRRGNGNFFGASLLPIHVLVKSRAELANAASTLLNKNECLQGLQSPRSKVSAIQKGYGSSDLNFL